MFVTDVSDCVAHSISLCADSICSSLLEMESIIFEENPAINTLIVGDFKTTLIIDRRNISLFEEVFIVGSTRDPAVNASLSALIVVCGDQLRYAAEDGDALLTVK